MRSPPLNLAPLLGLLPPELADQLHRTGDLPVAERARLAGDLRAQLAACAAYIPQRLVRAQLAGPRPGHTSGAFWEGSLLFADLSGFTALSSQLSVLGRQGAEEVSAVVNRLFGALVAEIQSHQGALLKFGGDAITAFFDTDHLGADHAAAASAAALAMQQRMAEFATVETRAGTFTLQLRVGVHSGRVFAAEVGDENHIELVVTGPEVNRVALAQEIAAPGEVVITEQTAALLEGARLTPRSAGFLHISGLRFYAPPPSQPGLTPRDGPSDLADLARLAAQLAALRPYLVRGLPRRFLEASDAGLGEFRPVSVLFANFHDFSAILERLHDDPARAAAVLNAYYRRAQAVVHRYDGIVNKVDMYTHGDKLMALFGAPTAHEDDPTRAVRCAVELERALAEANAEIDQLLLHEPGGARLVQKIGINTGTVFAGRVGGATRYEYTVMGPAVNLAARLMSAASDGEIILSPSTRAVVANQFVLEAGAPLRLKGISEPVVPALVRGVVAVNMRNREASTQARLQTTELIGREAELAALLAGAAAALNGSGRVLALVGDAGAGKTRLGEELTRLLVKASVNPEKLPPVPPFDLYLGECQSYEQRTPYAAILGPLRDLLGLNNQRADQTPAETVARLLARIHQLAPQVERFAPLIGDAIGVAIPETRLTQALSPQQRHDRLQELIVALFQGSAGREPLLVVIEDIHWADSPSLEVIGRLSAACAGRPLLLLLSYRPEPPIPAPWDDRPETVRLVLGELPPGDSAVLLRALLGGEPPAQILPLLERTQGNPFFIEELVRALILGGVLVRDEANTWQIARSLEDVELPKSIEGLLIARLDRLDEPRQELVQVASVIGRRFQRPIVEGVYINQQQLDESLQRLVAIELIQADQLDRVLAYLFRHALLRDVAYEGILYARRRVLHGRVARRIEELSRHDLDPHLPLLAWHYLQAEELRPAFAYHIRAAEQARRRFANRDALAFSKTALEIAPKLATSVEPAWLIAQVAAIHEQSGEICALLGESDAALRHYHEALDLARISPQTTAESQVRLNRLIAGVHESRSEYDTAFDRLEQGMAIATSDARSELARCYLLGAGIYYRQSQYDRAMEWARIGRNAAQEQSLAAEQGHALRLMGSIWHDQGDFTQSVAALEEARDLFTQLNDLTQLGQTLNTLGNVYTRLGRWSDTIRCFEQSLQINEMIGDVLTVARASNNLAVLLVGRNQLDRAADLYQLSSRQFGKVGSALGVAVTTYNRGEVLLLQGRPAEALPLFTNTIADLERIKGRNFLPEVLRLAAEACLALGRSADARDYAARSLQLADELGMAAEQAIARRALAQVAMHEGDLAAAGDLLGQSYSALAQLDSPYDLGKTCYQQARLAQTIGDHAAFEAAYRRAEQIFGELDAQRDLMLLRELAF